MTSKRPTVPPGPQAERVAESEGFPRVVLLDTVSYCNLRCSMCYHNRMKRKKGFMSRELFTKIIDEIAETDPSVRVWMVFFGEALLTKRRKYSIFDMISYAKERGLQDVVLNSNGNLLDRESSRRLIESQLDAIYFGIDAATEETYRTLRVGGNYRQTVDNIRGLLELKAKTGAPTPEVFVQFVEMESNRAETEDFVRFWSEAGATVKIRPMVSWAGMVEAPNLVLDNSKRWPCHWAMQTMSITDAGKVVTCAVDLDGLHVAGDVSRRSLKEIWNGPLRDLRLRHLEKRFDDLPPHCRDCGDWQSARADYYSGGDGG